MAIENTKKLVKNINLTPDEQVMGLIDANTHNAIGRAARNAYKCLALIAGGTPYNTACKLTGIPRNTLQTWRSKEWYAQAIEIIRKQLDEQLDGRMTSVINKSMDRLEERIELGDPVVNKDGSIGYKPVSAKDTAIISSIFFDKRNLLRNKPTSISSSQSTNERLQSLAESFRKIATVDGEYYEVQEEIDNVTEHSEVNHGVKGQQTQTDANLPKRAGRELEQGIQFTKVNECIEESESSEGQIEKQFTFKTA